MSNHNPLETALETHLVEQKSPCVGPSSVSCVCAPTSWSAQSIRTLRHDLGAKLVLGSAVGALATVMYQALQRFPLYAPEMRSDCFAWRCLPFNAWWTWPYFSMFLIVGLAWLFLPTAEEAWRFARYLTVVAAVGWLTFLFYPTGVVRPHLESAPWFYRILVSIDGPTNCLPCLHVAFVIMAGAALVIRGRTLSTLFGRLFVTAWIALITVSIVALHQHTDSDTLVGLLLGSAAAWAYTQRNRCAVFCG